MEIFDFLEEEKETVLRIPFIFKEWKIKPLTVAQMMEINPIIAKMEMSDLSDLEKDLKDGDIVKAMNYQLKYSKEMNKIITIIIGKDISKDMTPDDMLVIFLAIIHRMGQKSFLKSISLIRGLNLQEKAELIAANKRITESMILPNC